MRLVLWLGTVVLATRLCGEPVASNPAANAFSKFDPVAACPALATIAAADTIPLEGIDPPIEAGVIHPDDSLTALITLFQKGGRRTQWLLYLQAQAPNAEAEVVEPSKPVVMYSSTGNKLEFLSSPAFVKLRTLGPYAEPEARGNASKSADTKVHFNLDQGFLGLGLDHAATAALRLRHTNTKGAFRLSGKPFSEAEIRKSRQLLEQVQLTVEDERALAGAAPALISYFSLVQQTAGLSDILFQIVDKPSVWSVVRHAGVHADIAFESEHIVTADGTAWGLPAGTLVYHLPMTLRINGQPALKLTFVVTAPRPPLLACGGVVGLLAEKPGDEKTYMTVRVVSARIAGTKP